MHTTWSDGDDTLEAMIAAAAARGYEYHAISDHSRGPSAPLRHGRRRASPAARRDRSPERALSGFARCCASEVDILPDGSLDFDDERPCRARRRDRVGAYGDEPIPRADDGASDSCLRESVRDDHRPSDRPSLRCFDGLSARATSSTTTRSSPRRRAPGTALEIDGQAARLDLPAPLARNGEDPSA